MVPQQSYVAETTFQQAVAEVEREQEIQRHADTNVEVEMLKWRAQQLRELAQEEFQNNAAVRERLAGTR